MASWPRLTETLANTSTSFLESNLGRISYTLPNIALQVYVIPLSKLEHHKQTIEQPLLWHADPITQTCNPRYRSDAKEHPNLNSQPAHSSTRIGDSIAATAVRLMCAQTTIGTTASAALLCCDFHLAIIPSGVEAANGSQLALPPAVL